MKKNLNRVVVITGASSGLGFATYKHFEENGDIPVCLSLTNSPNLENFFECDVSSEDSVKKAFSDVFEKFGRIDILINNAGIATSGALEFEEKSQIDKEFAVNAIGPMLCYQSALKYMQKGAKIFNISSICASCPVAFRGYYGGSKSALTNMGLTAYMELKQSGVSVCTLNLGQTRTPLEKHRQNNTKTNWRYEKRIEGNLKNLQKDQSKRMSAESVAKKLYNLSTKKHPKPFIVVGFKFKMAYALYKILPMKWFLDISNKFLGF